MISGRKENLGMIWEVLGIDPTDDPDVIREAYRAKLIVTNPEDNPEGFMRLKEAYDEALKLLESKGDVEEERPYAEVIAEVDEIYKDINKRMDIECWRKLFENPVFTSLDEQEEVRNEFLAYVMEHFKFSGEVLEKINSVFLITHDREALSEIFPSEFISYLCNVIENDGDYILSEKPVCGRENGVPEVNAVTVDGVPEESENEYEYEIDEYITTINRFINYYRALESEDIAENEEAGKSILNKLAAGILHLREMDFYHPFEEIAVIRYLYFDGRFEECFSLAEKAVKRAVLGGEKHSDFYFSHLVFMYLRFFVQDIHKDMGLSISPEILEKCKAVISKTMKEIFVNETHPAMSLISYLEGDKKHAADYMSYVHNYIRNSAVYLEFSEQIDRERMEELEALIGEGAGTEREKVSLAWIYSRNEKREEALKLLEDIQPDNEKTEAEYHYLSGWLLAGEQKYEEALPHLQKLKDFLIEKYGNEKREDLEDLSIEDVLGVNRLPYVYFLIGTGYAYCEDLDNAKANVQEALRLAKSFDYYDYVRLYDYILLNRQEYAEGVEFWSREIEKNNSYVTVSHGNRQYMAYKAGDARTVIDDYYYLRENDPAYADSYVLAEEIFLDYSDAEGYEDAQKYVEENNVEDVRLDYCKGRYYRLIKEPYHAIELFRKVEAAINEGYDGIDEQQRFYISYGYALMDAEHQKAPELDRDEALSKLKELIQKAKEQYPDDKNIRWLEIDYLERYESSADEEYKLMMEKFPEDNGIIFEYGKYLNARGRRDEAAGCFEEVLQKDPDNADAMYKLSEYYNDVRFVEREEKEYSGKAISLAKKLVDKKYDGRYSVNYVLMLVDALLYDEAREFIEKAAVDLEDDPYVQNAHGIVCMKQGDYESAEQSFRKAVEIYKGSGRFAGYTNLVKLYQIMNRFDESVKAYKEFMEKFDYYDAFSYDKLADLCDDAKDYKEAAAYRTKAFMSKLSGITGREDDEEYISLCKAVDKYPEIPVYRFLQLFSYIGDIAKTFSFENDIDKMKEIEKDFLAYSERLGVMKPAKSEASKEEKDARRNMAYDIAYHFVYVHRDHEMCIKYSEKYLEYLLLSEDESRGYYLDVSKVYELMARSYMYAGDRENAAKYAEKAISYIEKGYGSVDAYLAYERLFPYRACKISGLYFYMGDKERAASLLDKTDNCIKCYHCVHSTCVDKNDRLALMAEVDGDYDQAIEYYKKGIELGGNDVERSSGIRECLRARN